MPELVHLHDIQPRGPALARWERIRHRQARWFVECLAEATGTFIYSYAGGAVQNTFILTNLAAIPGVPSLFAVGMAYAVGVILALTITSATSGGHINPCVTITFMLFNKFPVAKGLRFIAAQIFGAFVAFGCLYVQFYPTIKEIEEVLIEKKAYDSVMFTPSGPAGAFALYAPAGVNLGYVFMNEFIVDFMLGLAIFACLDPTNLLVPPPMAPWVIGFAYGMIVWGFSVNGIAANAARDVGGRLVAVSVWGTQASGGAYAAIAALTNIPATILAALYYNIFLADTQRVVNPAQKVFRDAHLAHELRTDRIRTGENMSETSGSDTRDAEKQGITHIEHRN